MSSSARSERLSGAGRSRLHAPFVGLVVRLVVRLVVGLVVGLGILTPAQSADFGVLMQQRGQHPLHATIGLPAAASRPVGHSEWQVAVEHANTFAGGVRGEEVLLLDGESTELVVRHRRRLGQCWHAELALPFVSHSSGWADQAIDDWHKAFGLPDAERDTFPMFQLDHVWLDADGRRKRLNESTSGVGDVQIAVQRPLGCRANAPTASSAPEQIALARVGIKLPTGDPERLSGSGATDVYADLQSPVWSLTTRGRAAASIGVLVPGDSPLLARQRPVAVFGAVGAEWRVHARWRLQAQIDWHTPFQNSALRELGTPAAALGVGLRYRSSTHVRWEFSISEDALIDATPDIVARVAWTWRPRR